MNLNKLIFTENACYKAGRKIEVKGIMVRSTGANNPNPRRHVGPDDGLQDAVYFGKVYKEAVELCAYLCKEDGLTEKPMEADSLHRVNLVVQVGTYKYRENGETQLKKLHEAGSILENALKMGAPVPEWLVKLLKASLQMVDGAGETAADIEVKE